jgi:two-component system chemotaxis sensor kinase CheA
MNTEFHQEYIEEAKKLLKDLEESLLLLEKDFANADQIANVYRYLHTLKGTADMFGFKDIEKITHELESVYSDVRDGTRTNDVDLLDLTLHALDVLKTLLEGNSNPSLIDELLHDIIVIKASGTDSKGLSAATKKEEKCFAIVLQPDNNIFKRGINFKNILADIEEIGQSELIIHNELIPFEKQLENKDVNSHIEVILVSAASLQEVKDIFLFLLPHEYSIFQVESLTLFTSAEYQQLIPLTQSQVEYRLDLVKKLLPVLINANESVVDLDFTHNVGATSETVEKPQEKTTNKARKSNRINVACEKLDQMIDIVSELVIFRSELQHLLGNSEKVEVVEAIEKLDRLTLNLRDSAFNIRLVPLTILNVKLERLIRSVSRELGKEVEFITEGLETELDRSMINALEAPLMHLIRNALDHGIEKPEERKRRNKPEKGLLKLFSYNSGDHVFIQIQDDGNGIDFDKVKKKAIEKGLINLDQKVSEKDLVNIMMTPGFSTAEKITTVSGRGVGLDVVKKEISAIRGEIEVSTEKELGSIFTLRLPLTLTILDTLIVEVSENKYLIPLNEIEYCYKEEHVNLFSKKSRQLSFGGQLLPFVSLREYFNIGEFPNTETVIVINKNDTKIAVVVDGIIGELQTVYKPLNQVLNSVECFSGASLLGDGSMALILDSLKLKN